MFEYVHTINKESKSAWCSRSIWPLQTFFCCSLERTTHTKYDFHTGYHLFNTLPTSIPKLWWRNYLFFWQMCRYMHYCYWFCMYCSLLCWWRLTLFQESVFEKQEVSPLTCCSSWTHSWAQQETLLSAADDLVFNVTHTHTHFYFSL